MSLIRAAGTLGPRIPLMPPRCSKVARIHPKCFLKAVQMCLRSRCRLLYSLVITSTSSTSKQLQKQMQIHMQLHAFSIFLSNYQHIRNNHTGLRHLVQTRIIRDSHRRIWICLCICICIWIPISASGTGSASASVFASASAFSSGFGSQVLSMGSYRVHTGCIQTVLQIGIIQDLHGSHAGFTQDSFRIHTGLLEDSSQIHTQDSDQ